MSRKWALIQLAKELGFLVRPDAVFGQHASTNQLFSIEATDGSSQIIIKFTLKKEIDYTLLKNSIDAFNKKRLAYVEFEPGTLTVSNFRSFSLSPNKCLLKIREAIVFWTSELQKVQNFEKFNSIALFPFGPYADTDAESNELFRENLNKIAEVDDKKAAIHASKIGMLAAIAIGALAAFVLHKTRSNIPFLEVIFLGGLIGRAYRSTTHFFTKTGTFYNILIFTVLIPVEQITKYLVFIKLQFPSMDMMKSLTHTLNLLIINIWPPLITWIVLSVLMAISIYKDKTFSKKVGVNLTEEHLKLADLNLLKSRISTWSASSIFLMFPALFLNIIYIIHDVVYPSFYPQLIIFISLIPVCFLINFLISKRLLGQSPFKRSYLESKFDFFEDNLGRCFSSLLFALVITLTINAINILLDPNSLDPVKAVLQEDLKNDGKSCSNINVEISGDFATSFSFCDEIQAPIKKGETITVYKGKGLFWIPYYKKD